MHHAINRYQLRLDVQRFLWPVYIVILYYLHGSLSCILGCNCTDYCAVCRLLTYVVLLKQITVQSLLPPSLPPSFPTSLPPPSLPPFCLQLGDLAQSEDALCEANILNNLDPVVWAYLTMVCLKVPPSTHTTLVLTAPVCCSI